jgi:CheY-like chemotaxis protein
LNPHSLGETDFKSAASTDSATRASIIFYSKLRHGIDKIFNLWQGIKCESWFKRIYWHENISNLVLAFAFLLWSKRHMNVPVLFVDDEESILKGIKLNLGRTFQVVTANGPHEALEIINEKGHFPVVVSDMRMPKMDGATLLRTIKEHNPDTKCILLTGHADFEFGGTEALQSGMLFKILNKPCPPEKLKNTINAALKGNDGGQEKEVKPDFVL